jgi:glycosyltransferase involved in cell wall biosynthesis
MHIVILNDSLPPESPGGAGRIAWQLGHGLIEAGHRVTFITATPKSSTVETRQGIPVHLLHSSYTKRLQAWFGLFNPQTIVPLNTLLRELRPDVVHAHNVHYHLGYHSLVIGRFAKATTVFTAHDVMSFAYTKLTAPFGPDRADQTEGFDYRLPFGYNWRQMRLRWNPARNLSIRHTMRYYVDARVAVSHELKTALEANDLPPFEVVHNGINPELFDVPEAGIEVLRQRFRLEGRRVILFGGRLNREKGDAQLLAALRQVKRQVPNVALLVLSRSDDYAQQLIAQNPDLVPTIIIGGWLEASELATAYHLADVVATPSVCFDSFPTVNLEGMAAGAPPVTTCFGGGKELVLDGETGFVVNPYDIDTLADRLTRLLTDDDLRRKMSAAGRHRIEQHFTLKHQIGQMLGVYERAIARRTKHHATDDTVPNQQTS